MSYGLYDGDLQFYPQVPFFNLELMKLSTYYKRRREIVTLSLNFKPNMYSHFIIRQDYPFNSTYPTYPNVEYGGRAFSSMKYKPLPLEIEVMRPDISLYDKVKVPHLNKKVVKGAVSTMRRAEHIRLSLDEKTIWPDWEKQLRRNQNCFGVIFHDYNLAEINGAFELIRDNLNSLIAHAGGRRIGSKFPIVTTTEQDFINWYSLPAMGNYYYLQYDGILTPNIIPYIEKLHMPEQIIVNVTANTTYEQFISQDIITLFKSILDLRRVDIVFPLTYEKGFFADSRWVDVMDLICRFNNRSVYKANNQDYFKRVVPYETLYSYVKKFVDDEKTYGYTTRRKDKYTNLFQFVRENNYDLFKLFYEYTGEIK